MRIGLRIDVDTLRGTRIGVPRLLRVLGDRELVGTFFFSVGPDNMGRHLWRLARPAFARKMLRSRAPALYGWDILLRGTLWPGPRIGERLAGTLQATRRDGHEIGLHAWDHHAWQAHVGSWPTERVEREIARGFAALADILGQPPACSAAPGWRCTDRVLEAKARFPFVYNSDCRGESVFAPVFLASGPLQVQVPVTLPTYDEMVGRDGTDGASYYDRLASMLDADRLNVVAFHAEVEGIGRSTEFAAFLDATLAHGWRFEPLGRLVTELPRPAAARIERREIAGREGWVAQQVAV